MTAVSNTVFTAAQFNTYVRDNLNETAPAKATTAGQIFVSAAANSIAARTPTAGYINTTETTTSNTYADLTTPGPAVTVTTGTQALVSLYCSSSNSGAAAALMSYAVSGATTIAAPDTVTVGVAGTQGSRQGNLILQGALTAGSNTFTAKYRVGSGTGTYTDRRILVIPL